ncbi:RDD family protein [Marmoricola sp. Leaf446]|uniref:RDD family protein n=1 Tax=Marmoricola sp. Leaf446 TaxID=1736379 RepID=UPI0009E7CC85|nr:RDD family protein [Marmoricola sp. Leaf446]
MSAAAPDWGSEDGDAGAWGAGDLLVTGEAVALDLPAASLGVRVLSGLVDLVAQGVLLVLGLVLVAIAAPDEALAAAGSVVVTAATLVLGPAVVETLTSGRSLGKLVLGLRTVRDDAGPPSFHHCVVRHLLSVVEIWVMAGVPALVSALLSRRGKRLGDLVAGTYVVRDRFALRLPWPVTMPPPLAAWAARADIAPLPDALALTVHRLLGRGEGLDPRAHERLLLRTAAEVSRHVAPAPPPGTPPGAFLAAVSAERRARDERRLRGEVAQRQRLARRH